MKYGAVARVRQREREHVSTHAVPQECIASSTAVETHRHRRTNRFEARHAGIIFK